MILDDKKINFVTPILFSELEAKLGPENFEWGYVSYNESLTNDELLQIIVKGNEDGDLLYDNQWIVVFEPKTCIVTGFLNPCGGNGYPSIYERTIIKDVLSLIKHLEKCGINVADE